jgi:hypothetical protein
VFWVFRRHRLLERARRRRRKLAAVSRQMLAVSDQAQRAIAQAIYATRPPEVQFPVSQWRLPLVWFSPWPSPLASCELTTAEEHRTKKVILHKLYIHVCVCACVCVYARVSASYCVAYKDDNWRWFILKMPVSLWIIVMHLLNGFCEIIKCHGD